MDFFWGSRSLGLYMQKPLLRPTAQISVHQISLGFTTTRSFNSSFSSSTHPNPLVRESHLFKAIPSSGFRPFCSSASWARASRRRDPQPNELSKWEQREKDSKDKFQNKRSQHARDDYYYIDPTPVQRYRSPKYSYPNSSFPLAVLIAVGCTYVTLSYNRSPFAEFPLPSIVPKFTPSFLEKHFILSQKNIDEGRFYTLITNSFMHATYPHLLMNMTGLFYLVPFVTPLTFVAVWTGASITCSLASLYTWKHGLPFDHVQPSLHVIHQGCGASGSLFGLLTMTAIKYPNLTWQIMFIPIGIPGWLLIAGESIFSVLALKYGWIPNLGHAGHLGGTAFGLLAGILSMRFGLKRF